MSVLLSRESLDHSTAGVANILEEHRASARSQRTRRSRSAPVGSAFFPFGGMARSLIASFTRTQSSGS